MKRSIFVRGIYRELLFQELERPTRVLCDVVGLSVENSLFGHLPTFETFHIQMFIWKGIQMEGHLAHALKKLLGVHY